MCMWVRLRCAHHTTCLLTPIAGGNRVVQLVLQLLAEQHTPGPPQGQTYPLALCLLLWGGGWWQSVFTAF